MVEVSFRVVMLYLLCTRQFSWHGGIEQQVSVCVTLGCSGSQALGIHSKSLGLLTAYGQRSWKLQG